MMNEKMLRAKCTSETRNWWRLIDRNGNWLDMIKMDETPDYYIWLAARMGVDIMFIPSKELSLSIDYPAMKAETRRLEENNV